MVSPRYPPAGGPRSAPTNPESRQGRCCSARRHRSCAVRSKYKAWTQRTNSPPARRRSRWWRPASTRTRPRRGVTSTRSGHRGTVPERIRLPCHRIPDHNAAPGGSAGTARVAGGQRHRPVRYRRRWGKKVRGPDRPGGEGRVGAAPRPAGGCRAERSRCGAGRVGRLTAEGSAGLQPNDLPHRRRSGPGTQPLPTPHRCMNGQPNQNVPSDKRYTAAPGQKVTGTRRPRATAARRQPARTAASSFRTSVPGRSPAAARALAAAVCSSDRAVGPSPGSTVISAASATAPTSRATSVGPDTDR